MYTLLDHTLMHTLYTLMYTLHTVQCTPCKLHLNHDTRCRGHTGCALQSLHRNVIVHSARCHVHLFEHCTCLFKPGLHHSHWALHVAERYTHSARQSPLLCSAQCSCTFIVGVLYLVQVLSRAIHGGYHLPCRVNTARSSIFKHPSMERL